MSTEGGLKAVVAALLANVGIAVAKFVAFLFTGSSSMLSEAVHSVADSGNQILLLVGNKRSNRRSTSKHQFGYGRVRYLYGFIVAIVLFLVGGLFSAFEGWHKIQNPEPLNDAGVAIAVLGVAVILEGLSLRTALAEARKMRGRHGLFSFLRRTRNPEISVILLEDTGALIGLVFAVVGVVMATVTGDGRWDGLGAAAVGTLLIVIAVFLGIEMASLLTGESAVPEEERAIRQAIESTDGVVRVIHMRTLHLGPDELLVAAKIAVEPTQTAARVSAIIDAAEGRLRESVVEECVVYLEPDVYRHAQDVAGSQPVEPTGPGAGGP